jgi:hypothetical protein
MIHGAQTPVDLILEPRDGFLLATASGEQSVDEALQTCRDMLEVAARLGMRKILLDCLALNGTSLLRNDLNSAKASLSIVNSGYESLLLR